MIDQAFLFWTYRSYDMLEPFLLDVADIDVSLGFVVDRETFPLSRSLSFLNLIMTGCPTK
jgi:hypothetical protein